MPLSVPVVQQPFGSYSCVPTCVYAVLVAEEDGNTEENGGSEEAVIIDEDKMQEISELCEETELGCDLDSVINGLQRDYDAAWLPSRSIPLKEAIELLRSTVMDEDDPHPVITAIQTDLRNPDDHAVVVTRLGDEDIEIMDPGYSGGRRMLSIDKVGQQWSFGGQRAFTVRPL